MSMHLWLCFLLQLLSALAFTNLVTVHGWEKWLGGSTSCHGCPQRLVPFQTKEVTQEHGFTLQRRITQESGRDEVPTTTEWPDEMLGDSEWSDYVSPVKIRHNGVKSCAGIRSPLKFKPRKVIAAGSMSEKEIRRMSSYDRLGDKYNGPRVMIWVAKNGLGNVLRGFLTTFFYAFLSGRQLLRWEAGAHGKVMKSLCHGFSCPYVDLLQYKKRLPKWSLNICHRNLAQTLTDRRPIVVGDCEMLLTFWSFNDSMRSCVLDSFGCVDEWCALSRAELLLMGGPAPSLGQVIDESMELVPALGQTFPKSTRPRGVAGRHLRQTQEVTNHTSAWTQLPTGGQEAPSHPPNRRGQRYSVSDSSLGSRAGSGKGDTMKRRGLQETSIVPPLGLGVRKPREKMAWVRRVAGLFLREPEDANTSGKTLAEPEVPRSLRLKFDLALHIRTLYRCVEKSASGPGCKGGDVNQAVAAARFSKELRKFVFSFDWHCLSNLLTFLQDLRSPQDEGFGKDPQERNPLFATEYSRKKLQSYLESTATFRMSKNRAYAMWSAEKSRFVADEHANMTGKSHRKLSIFLATDSEVLRPLFVEFLRPFGHVVYNRGKVVHLDRGTAEERARLPTVAEFFLLSKGSVLVSFTRRMSSFLRHAALYGNGTLISKGGEGGCKWNADHMAEIP